MDRAAGAELVERKIGLRTLVDCAGPGIVADAPQIRRRFSLARRSSFDFGPKCAKTRTKVAKTLPKLQNLLFLHSAKGLFFNLRKRDFANPFGTLHVRLSDLHLDHNEIRA